MLSHFIHLTHHGKQLFNVATVVGDIILPLTLKDITTQDGWAFQIFLNCISSEIISMINCWVLKMKASILQPKAKFWNMGIMGLYMSTGTETHTLAEQNCKSGVLSWQALEIPKMFKIN